MRYFAPTCISCSDQSMILSVILCRRHKHSFDALLIKSSILTPPSRHVDEFPSLAPCSLTLFVYQTPSFLRLFNLQMCNYSALHLPAITASGGLSSHVDIGDQSESHWHSWNFCTRKRTGWLGALPALRRHHLPVRTSVFFLKYCFSAVSV